MAHLVPDDAADRAVVDGIVSVRIEERRLQDGGWEYDFIERRVVVGVDGLRGHVPFVTVGRLAQPSLLAPPVEFAGTRGVAEGVAGTDQQGRVIAPFIRIADLGSKGGKLLQRDFLRVGAHPGKLLNIVSIRRAQALDQRKDLLLGALRKVTLHI